MAALAPPLVDLDGLSRRGAPSWLATVLLALTAAGAAAGTALTHYGGGLWQTVILLALWSGTAVLAWTYARREFLALAVFLLTFVYPMTINVSLIDIVGEPEPAGAPVSFRLWEKDIVLLLLGVDWLLSIVFRRPRNSYPLGWAPRGAALLLASALMFPFHSVCPTRSLVQWLELTRFVLAFVYLAKYVDRKGLVMAIAWGVMAQIWIESLVAIAQYLSGGSLGLRFLGETGTHDLELPQGAVIRTGALMGHPNRFALWLCLVSPLPLALALQRSAPFWQRCFCWATALLVYVVLVLTFSRAGWVCGAFNVFATYHLVQRRYGRPAVVSIALPMFGAIAAGLALFYGVEAINDRITAPDYGSTFGRIPQWFTAAKVISEFPITGTGLGSYTPYIFENANFDGRYISALRFRVHNGSLLMTAETGILGGIGYHLWLAAVARRGWGIWKVKDDFLALTGIATLVGVASWFIKSMYNIHTPVHDQSIWLHTAIIYMVWNAAARQEREQSAAA